MSGLLQEFKVSSDTDEQLKLVVGLPLFWHKSTTHYKSGVDKDGFSWLELRWTGADGATVLPFPLITQEEVYTFVKGWLKYAERGDAYDTDGSVSRGWLITHGDFYCTLRIQTEWIIYGK